MNKNSIIGITIIGVILVIFSMYNSRQMKNSASEQRRLDSIEHVRAANSIAAQQNETLQETTASVNMPLDTTPEKLYTLENDVITLTFTSKGGNICGAVVKNYTSYKGNPIVLMKDGVFSFEFYTNNSRNFETKNLIFDAPTEMQHYTMTADEQERRFAMRHAFAENCYVEYVYTLRQGAYMVEMSVNTVGLDNVTNLDLQWATDASRQEKAFSNENNYTTIAYRYPNEDGAEELSISSESKREEVKTKLQWVAFKQQFFSAILTAKSDAFASAQLSYDTYGDSEVSGLIKHYDARIQMPYQPQKDQSIALAFYFGPNKYSILKSYEQHFETLVPLGGWIIRWVNKFLVISIFDLLEKHIASYGLIILILTVIIKLLLFPLTYKSYISSAKMRVLKPDIDKINKKYPSKNDAMKKQQEIMGLYKKTGVSPMGGCLPILVQFPILIAMFRFFPASIELRQQSFLWADDLSAYDSIVNLPFSIPFYGDHVSLFTLLMAVALYISSRMNLAQTPDTTGVPGMKFMTLYLMPVMLLLWFNSYSAGLSYYYFLSNLITIAQNLITRRMVDEAKLHAKLKENSKKPVKKSNFQTKLEAMAKQAQQNQRKRSLSK